MKKFIALVVTCLFFLVSCDNSMPASSDELLEVEKAFSAMSVEKGMVEAFLYYCHDEGTLLRPSSYPIVGKEAVASTISGTADSLFTLTWEPSYARIANSGELGYTYGIYTLEYSMEGINTTQGTYLTIWTKNEDGEWRFLMDTGQEGLGE